MMTRKFVTIETEIEPPYVMVALADWNALNETVTIHGKLTEAAERRIAELEAQLAAQAWLPMENVPDGQDVELLVHGYIGDDGLWYYRDGTTPLKGWRPID